MAVCEGCPYIINCGDYAGFGMEGKEVVNCIRDLEEHGKLSEFERHLLLQNHELIKYMKKLCKQNKDILDELNAIKRKK